MSQDISHFFELLELDHGESNPTVIDRAIVAKQREWSRKANMGAPKARLKAKAHLDLIPEIKRVLLDANAREAAAKQARDRAEKAKREVARQARQDLDEWVRLIALDGCCSAEQLADLETRFSDRLPAGSVRAAMEAANIHLDTDSDGLDPTTQRAIVAQLGVIGQPNLYAFLGVSPDAPRQELARRARDREAEFRRQGKIDPVSSAGSALASLCVTLFREESGRRGYGAYFKEATLRPYIEKLEVIGKAGHVTTSQLRTLAETAETKGLDPEEARRGLTMHARKLGLTVTVDQVETKDVTRRRDGRSERSEPSTSPAEDLRSTASGHGPAAVRRGPVQPDPGRKADFLGALFLPLQQPKPVPKVATLMLVSCIPGFNVPLLLGWRHELMCNAFTGKKPVWPKSSPGRYLWRGLGLNLIACLYALVPLFGFAILAAAEIGSMFMGLVHWLQGTYQPSQGDGYNGLLLCLFGILPWMIYQSGKARALYRDSIWTILDVPANLHLIVSRPIPFIKLTLFIGLIWLGMAGIGIFFGQLGFPWLLFFPAFAAPLYFWASGYLMGQLAPAGSEHD
ncbi:DUF4013 domain-containing protein [Sulfidibacter corallicola]|uniref:DUF4013 domain-containing protein n=1 Tax=Sulfidibacter corallicola TaxID=2818388 RepID=A0A8A4TPI7_SULCO|nr:DUF4013 domain-containing protein [Sulfidibacter corallicola]QTD51460.1 DUF4013 domain-containing protein [Sulfidibacter corallicola]